jgi:LysM repeat protein
LSVVIVTAAIVADPTVIVDVVVTVAAGETLWSLASQMADGGDVQTLVADIASANSLSGVDVEAGQKLRIPGK